MLGSSELSDQKSQNPTHPGTETGSFKVTQLARLLFCFPLTLISYLDGSRICPVFLATECVTGFIVGGVQKQLSEFRVPGWGDCFSNTPGQGAMFPTWEGGGGGCRGRGIGRLGRNAQRLQGVLGRIGPCFIHVSTELRRCEGVAARQRQVLPLRC